MVLLRAAAARGSARRERAFHGKEPVLDCLFPCGDSDRPASDAVLDELPDHELEAMIERGRRAELVLERRRGGDSDQTPPPATKPHLPDDLFRLVVRYYWGGGLSPEEEAAEAAAAELVAAARQARAARRVAAMGL